MSAPATHLHWSALLLCPLLLLSLLAPAAADPLATLGPATRAVAHADLERVTSFESEASLQRGPRGDQVEARFDLLDEIRLSPSRLRKRAPYVWHLDQELPPETLELRFRVHSAFCFLLSADLSAELARLEAVDGDTYFVTGVEFRFQPDLALFVEDFQPASGVVGGGALEEEPAPAFSWDGHQVALGLRWWISARSQLDVAGVAYVLSSTRRDEEIGAYVTWSVRF